MRIAIALALMLSACSGQPQHRATGEQPTIVSLNPCADAILAEIAAPGQLLAISHYSHDPQASSMPASQAARYESTGGTAEEVLALSPDIVVADMFIQPATRRALEKAGIEVVTLDIAGSLDDSLAQIEALGRASGNVAAADTLSSEISQSWAAHRWSGRSVTAVLWQQGGIVAGERSLVNALLEHSGFENHASARGMGQGAYLPLENVLADPPRVVIAAGDERAFAHPAVRSGKGAQHHALDPGLLYCGGPTIPRAMERLSEIRREVQ